MGFWNCFEGGLMIGKICFVVVFFVFTGLAHAMEDHSRLMEKGYTNARDITLQCLECHATQGKDFVKTAHLLGQIQRCPLISIVNHGLSREV